MVSPSSRVVLPRPIRVALPIAFAIAFGLTLLSARPAHALIKGGCTATATASRSGETDLTAATDWNLVNEDVVRGQGNGPGGRPLTGVTINLELFGIPWPILSNSKAGTTGSAGPYLVSDYSWFARVWGATASAGGGTCTGWIRITVTNVSPLATLAGGGGAALGVLGLIGLLLTLRSSGDTGARVGGTLSGLLSGIGFGLLLQQTGTLDPTSLVDLLIPLVGVLAGAVLPGVLSRKP